MNFPARPRRNAGFTLVELLVVISLLAIISSLAIARLSKVRDSGRTKLNIANLTRIGAAVDSYIIAHDDRPAFDRLDALVHLDTPDGGSNASCMSANLPALLASADGTNGISLHPDLVAGLSAYGATFPSILSPYYLTAADVSALSNHLGMRYLMRGTDGDRFTTGDDGAWAQGSVTDPLAACCVAKALTNGMCVAAVNPGAVVGADAAIAPIGALVYRSCGQDISFTYRGRAMGLNVDGTVYEGASFAQDAFDALNASGGGGILLAFGLGAFASIVGSDAAGLDSAPICPVVTARDVYNRYLVLVRLRTTPGGERKATYAGVVDATGRPAGEARKALD
jgi:prepilin-type N-terminal cleavage/methylation domain-containing protein